MIRTVAVLAATIAAIIGGTFVTACWHLAEATRRYDPTRFYE